MSNVEIRINPNGTGSVVVDGHDLSKGVSDIRLEAGAGRLAVLVLDMPVWQGAVVDGEVRTVIPEGVREALVALGWTPPEDDR